MRTVHFVGSFFAIAVAFATYGCTLDLAGLAPGATGTTSASVGGAGPSSSTATAISAGPGGGTSSSGGGEAATTTGTGCIPSPEKCDDGIDNDCDGKVDCADSDCTDPGGGYACSPAAPAGWSVVSFSASASAQCPAGYGAPATLSTVDVPGAACTCACGGAPANLCTQGSLKIAFGHASCGGQMFTWPVTGGCDDLGAKIGHTGTTPFDDAAAPVLDVKNGPCAATPSQPPPLKTMTGVACAPSAPGGKGCGQNSACLPPVDKTNWCIESDGDKSCPGASFPHRRVVYDPSDIDDKRGCGSCACQSTATKCGGGKLTSYDNAACNGAGVSVVVDNTCNNLSAGDDENHSHVVYTATPDVTACAVTTPSAATGSVMLKNPHTICCP